MSVAARAGSLARRSCSHSALRCVAITGGTHGNECTGTSLAKYFMGSGKESTLRKSFETLAMVTNPAAVKTNTRYVETDMNRCFMVADLADESLAVRPWPRACAGCPGRGRHLDATQLKPLRAPRGLRAGQLLEHKRAKEVDAMLGPKASTDPKARVSACAPLCVLH